jgi:hypothetical protein
VGGLSASNNGFDVATRFPRRSSIGEAHILVVANSRPPFLTHVLKALSENRACSVGEFFKGWRRKAGLVALAMAVLLAMAWMRSYVIRDEVGLSANGHDLVVQSKHGRLLGISLDVEVVAGWTSQPHPSDSKFFGDHFYNRFSHSFEWQREICGINFGRGHLRQPGNPDAGFHAMQLPYWSLVLPLTLLSAWLILGKRRKAKGSG